LNNKAAIKIQKFDPFSVGKKNANLMSLMLKCKKIRKRQKATIKFFQEK